MYRAWKHFERDFFTSLFNQYNSFSVGLLVIITETDKEGLFVPINSIEEILEDFRHGRMVLIMDDEDRENEGDLIIPANFATPEQVNFMARHGRGLICLAMKHLLYGFPNLGSQPMPLQRNLHQDSA